VTGGELLVSIRSEPRTFNRFAGRSETTELITLLTQAKLVRINRQSQTIEPWLAESWTRSADGLVYTLKLRPNVEFSDGQPFTSADVLFSFAAVYDASTQSPLADSLEVNGKRLVASAPDPYSVSIAFPSAFGPGLRLLDNLPILPRHKLEPALQSGTLARAWGVTTPPGEIVGLGPFVISEYAPGERVVLSRNSRYWRTDAAGTRLPYLDRVTLEIVADQEAEILRLESGQIDALSGEVRPEDYALLKRAADAGTLHLLDLGVAYDADSFWFNLKPGAFGSTPRAAWLQSDALRRAISLAIDRQAFADAVFLGAGVPVYGPITPANTAWYFETAGQPSHDPTRAGELLGSVGLVETNGDGLLEDAENRPARFTLLTVKGATQLERGAAVIRDELRRIGLLVDVVALDQGAVVQRFLSGDYDSVYFHVTTTDTDPAVNPDFWLSRGSAHVWNLAQASPATPWERQIDELMTRQMASDDVRERKRLFDEVQQVFSDHLPVVYFVAPRVYVAVSSRVTNLTPAATRPQLLWSADTIAVAGTARGAR
jgi:peptide/nickel transport system substrate-binding protein